LKRSVTTGRSWQNCSDKSKHLKPFDIIISDDLIFKCFRKADCQKEFEDFTDESRQLEQELETTLIQNEKQIRDLNGMIMSLREDNDSLRVKVWHFLIDHKVTHCVLLLF
jgi:predicted RNase H-like nuclease (RuvC/YqgF family)